MAHTLSALEGFDSGSYESLGTLAGTAPSFETLITSKSQKAARWALSGGAGNISFFPAAVPYGWATLHFYIVALPTGVLKYELAHFQHSGGGNGQLRCRIDANGLIGVVSQLTGSEVTVLGTVPLTTGKWYVLSFHLSQASPDELRAIVRDRDSGATVDDVSHSAAMPNTNIFNIDIGPSTTSTGDVVFDNVIIESGLTADIDDPVAMVGTLYSILNSFPTGVGAYDSGWTNDWTYLDEAPYDGVATERGVSTVGAVYTMTFQPIPGAVNIPIQTIYAVDHRAWYDCSVSEQHDMRLRIDGVDSDQATGVIPTTYTFYRRHMLLNPITGLAWTMAEFNRAEFGTERTDATNGSSCSAERINILVGIGRGGGNLAFILGFKRLMDELKSARLPGRELQRRFGQLQRGLVTI